MLSGRTRIIAHLGFPTEAFQAPMIYNPWFASKGIDAAVVPLGVRSEDYRATVALLPRLTNLHGALVTMPHKIVTADLMDELSPAASIAGACNAVLCRADGSLLGDMFDGAGFVRGVARKGRPIAGARVLVIGCGGVGRAIAAAFAAADIAAIGLFDISAGAAGTLADRLAAHVPDLQIQTGSNDPAGFDIVVNATPLGLHPGDRLPLDISRLSPDIFVGDVVMAGEVTPLLRAARARGCPVQAGTDMLFEMIPAYLEFFGFGTATPEDLRLVAQIQS